MEFYYHVSVGTLYIRRKWSRASALSIYVCITPWHHLSVEHQGRWNHGGATCCFSAELHRTAAGSAAVSLSHRRNGSGVYTSCDVSSCDMSSCVD